jgi:hypothetical protein
VSISQSDWSIFVEKVAKKFKKLRATALAISTPTLHDYVLEAVIRHRPSSILLVHFEYSTGRLPHRTTLHHSEGSQIFQKHLG